MASTRIFTEKIPNKDINIFFEALNRRINFLDNSIEMDRFETYTILRLLPFGENYGGVLQYNIEDDNIRFHINGEKIMFNTY